MKILVLGIGNIILRDDGIGPAVIRELHRFGLPQDVCLETTNLSGIALLDLTAGYDTLILVDAIKSGKKPGQMTWAQTNDFKVPDTIPSQHKMDIFHMLEIGRQMGINVPNKVSIMAIEAEDVTSFGEYLTPEVARVIPAAAAKIAEQILLLNKENQPAEELQANKTIFKG